MSAMAQEGGIRPGAARTRLVVNFVAFQAGWFACVLGAAHGWPVAGTAIACIIVAAHILMARQPREELMLVAIAVAIGLIWDSSLLAMGWIGFTSGFVVEGIAPHWIVALWALFAMTLNVSLRWLKSRIALAAIMGAIAGPLAYWGGARLGAVSFVEPVLGTVALSIGWAVLTPALALIARRFDGIDPVASS